MATQRHDDHDENNDTVHDEHDSVHGERDEHTTTMGPGLRGSRRTACLNWSAQSNSLKISLDSRPHGRVAISPDRSPRRSSGPF
jgi:hypothetical protein